MCPQPLLFVLFWNSLMFRFFTSIFYFYWSFFFHELVISLSQKIWRSVSSSLFHLRDWPDLDQHISTKKGLRDCQQITLILGNRIFLVTKNCTLTLLFLADNIEMDKIPTKIKWKYMSLLHCISVIKICMISHQIFYFLLFLLAFTSSRYHFSQIFRTSFNIWQKDFCHKFSFFNRFTQTTTPSPPTLP